MMSKTRLLTLICACFLFLSFKNAFAFSLIHDLPYQRSNGITYTDVIATRDNLQTYYAYYDIPVNGSIPDITRYGFDWGISFGCNGPSCTSPGYHLYMITCDPNNNNCVDGYDTGTGTQVVGSAVGQPTCWDNDHVSVSRGFVWYYDYLGLCGVGDVTAGSVFFANYNIIPGLVAYWSFDNCDATDDSGNGHNGTIYGNPLCVDGEKGKGYSFDGQDDYIEVPNAESLNPAGVTISAWFTVHSYGSPGWCNFPTLIFKQSPKDVDNTYYAIALLNDYQGWPIGCLSSSTWSVSGPNAYVWSQQPLPLDEWHHVVATMNSTEVREYIDGQLQGVSSTGFPLDPGSRPLYIGYTGMFCGAHWNGLIDEVRIYNRALNEAEIQALYSVRSFKLPDTGQTTCYDTSGNVIGCAGTGQDGAYNINPLSYTDNDNGTVTDNNTGLMWQKEDDGSTYNWYRASGTYDANFNPESTDVCGSLDLDGVTDWRLPTKKELMSIVDYGIPYPGPTINATYFPNTKSSYYWSSTTVAVDPGHAWDVHFYYGVVYFIYKGHDVYVRCVRREQVPEPNLIDNGNGTVKDNETGLIWQQGEPGYMNWDSALSYCEGLSLGGHSDWRLPNIKELESLTDDTRYFPAIDTNFFPNAYDTNYWLSTTYASNPGVAWYVGFGHGQVYCDYKFYYPCVRCVRGGQVGDSDNDSLPDSWEISHFGDLIQNPGDDYDHDELTNLQEYQLGTDPTKWDTDGDGVNDGTEVANGTNPLIPDVTLEPNISVEPLSQDFGELFVGDCDLQLFTVKNTGNADLNVSGISLSDTTNYDFDTTIIYACSTNGQTITPGDSCNVVVKFCPSTSGTFEANLSLSSNDPDTLTLNVPVTGSAKKLCDPPGTVYAKNDNAYGLFEGTVHDVETGDTTTVVIDIQGTDLIDLPLLKPWRLELWVSIDKITFDSSVVTAVEPNGNGSDDLGAFFADEHVIAPGTHASFQASFCKPGTITFELGHNIKAQLLTAADFYLSVFGNFTPDQVFKFADSIDNIPLVASSLKHISNAFDAAANKKLGKARKELTLAAEDVRKIASNKGQFNQLLNAYVDLGLNISAKKLVSALLKGIPFKMIKVFGDAIVYNIKTGLGTKPIQIIVIAN